MNEIANLLQEYADLKQFMGKYFNNIKSGSLTSKSGFKDVLRIASELAGTKGISYSLESNENGYHANLTSAGEGEGLYPSIFIPPYYNKLPVLSFSISNRNLMSLYIPETVEYLPTSCTFRTNISKALVLPKSIKEIQATAFDDRTTSSVITPTQLCKEMYILSDAKDIVISPYAFEHPEIAPNKIYVSWAKGEVAGAPWGATNSTIIYNHKYEGTEY